ncbi:LysM peptidoglycan-binding domain-containing protein [Bacillus infantis]|uniref:LysM peptidoglycan-binding domain-containing protein n=1 Tax=Bacillus infantis TaxID=324767 RepID=UPI001CD65F51|nr:LysM peptidoglycan-binding domain-containing protein [Bacillus infantis]MCA1038501.1 LysM peptidoglycan-binding domain-containing protein [Bacillus infantis]
MKKAKKLAASALVALSILTFSQGQASAEEYHTIKKGDTLYSIAKQYGSTVGQLKHINKLKSDRIYAGSKLEVPGTITVKKGDTLWGIGQKYALSVTELKKINGLKSDLIVIGQKLSVNKGIAASYDADKVKVSVSVKKGYTFHAEEPRRFLLEYGKNARYFARVEVLDGNSVMDEVKRNSLDYLRTIGKPEEMKSVLLPFYRDSMMVLHAHNRTDQANIIVRKVEGKLLRITIHYVNQEESEEVYETMISILGSMKAN